jgi:hypothetical protein
MNFTVDSSSPVRGWRAVRSIAENAPSWMRRASLGWIQAQWAITGSPSDGSRARFGMRNAAITAPTTKNPEPQARVAV